jgi:hypothetical protein
MISISVRSNAAALQRQLSDLAKTQLPFAIAQGINKTAARVAEAEQQNIRDTFEHPTPFTQNSVGLRKARKSNPTALIYMKDIAAAYLRPYETGGVHKLNSRALLNPKDIRLNQYGQMSRGTLNTLKSRPDVFIGTVKMTSGEAINGVWQRPTDKKRVTLLNAKGGRLNKIHKLDSEKNGGRGQLKLLLRFGDALPVNKQLNWGKKAREIVEKWIDRDMAEAVAKALETAKRK